MFAHLNLCRIDFQFPDFSNYRVVICYTGAVRWEPSGMFETSCKIDIHYYLYDKQTYEVIFGTLMNTSRQLNMTNSTGTVIMDDYNTSGQWDVTNTVVARREFVYDSFPDMRFSKVAATIKLTRRHGFYTMNIIMPCVMLSMLALVTFLSPPDHGEKISLGISILLSFSVFMLTLTDNMPKNSETLPLFGKLTALLEWL